MLGQQKLKISKSHRLPFKLGVQNEQQSKVNKLLGVPGFQAVGSTDSECTQRHSRRAECQFKSVLCKHCGVWVVKYSRN